MTLEQDDVVRIALTGVSPLTQVFQHVFHLQRTNAGSMDEDDALAGVAAKWAVAFGEVIAVISDTYSWVEWEMWKRDATAHEWNGISSLATPTVDGDLAGDPIPHGAAAVGRYATQVLRRQGKTFLPGWGQESIDLGLLDAAALVDFADFMAEFVEDHVDGGLILQKCTYNTDPTSSFYETASLVNGVVFANDVVGYQRRRKPNVGL